MNFPAATIHGNIVNIVDKEPLGSQGRVLLTDDEGEKYVADLSGLQITPIAEWDRTAENVPAKLVEDLGVGATLESGSEEPANAEPEGDPAESVGGTPDGDGTQLVT